MKRRIGAVLASVLLAGIAVIPGSPASAARADVCVGQGTATTPPIYYPIVQAPGIPPVRVGPAANGVATLNIGIGACSNGGIGSIPGFATVTITGAAAVGGGYCGHSIGVNGTVLGTNVFGYFSVGSMLLVNPIVNPGGTAAGGGRNVALNNTAVGLVNAIPDATASQSCLTGATLFLVTGVVATIY